MTYRQIPPGPSVQDWVDHYWILESGSSGSAPQRVVPDGSPELIFNFADAFESLQDGEWRRQPRSFLAGQITGPLFLRQAGSARMIGVRLTPQGISRLFGLPAGETTGRIVPIGDLSTRLARDTECSADCETVEERIACIETALAGTANKHGARDLLVEEAVARIGTSSIPPDVSRLARSLGVSVRQLQRRFSNVVGLGPKHFARVRRFQAVFQAVERGGGWADVAGECGYYDQAHLIRDFREFSGETPTALLDCSDLARHFLRGGMSHFSKTRGAGPV